MLTNYQLYARILRLHHLSTHVSMTAEHNANMAAIVRNVIFPDNDLVWC